MVNKLMRLLFFLTPTSIAALLPEYFKISLSRKYSGIGVGFLLLIIFFFSVIKKMKWKKTSIDLFIFLYLIVNLFYFFVFIQNYGPSSNELVGQQKILILSAFSFLFFFPVYYFANNKMIVGNLLKSFIIGICFTASINIFLCLTILLSQGTFDLYTIKSTFALIALDLRHLEPWQIEQKYSSIGNIILFGINFMNGMTNTVLLANILGFGTVLVFGLSLIKKSKILILNFLILLVSSLLLTQRSAMLAIFIGCVSMYIIYDIVNKRNIEKTISKTFFFSMLLLSLFIAFSMTQKGLSNKLTQEGMLKEPRWELWNNAIHLTLLNPYGYGYMYIANEKKYNNGGFPENITFKYDNPHNGFLENGLNYGFLGLFSYLCIVVLPLVRAYKNIRFLIRNRISISLIKLDPYLQVKLLGLPLLLTSFVGIIFTGHIYLYVSSYTLTIVLFTALIFRANLHGKSSLNCLN